MAHRIFSIFEKMSGEFLFTIEYRARPPSKTAKHYMLTIESRTADS
jgi:hypothetical protein